MSDRDTSRWGVSRRTYLRGIGLAGLAAVSSEPALSQLGDSDVVGVGSGNYATARPEGVYDTPDESYLFSTDNVDAPYPTNGWWQRELVGTASVDSLEPYPDGFGIINAVPSMALSKENGDGFYTYYGKEWGGDPSTAGNLSVDYDGSPGLDVGHAATEEFDGSYVDGWGDWHVRVQYGSGTPNLTATFVKGSAFTFCEYEGGEAQLALVDADDNAVDGSSTSVFYDGGNVLGVSVTANGQQKDYGIFAPEGVTFDGVGDGSLSSNPITTSGLIDNDGYLSIAPMPDATPETIQEFANYAYNFVTDTTVDWEYVQADGDGNPVSEVRTTFDYTLDQKAESSNAETLSWLFPHHWKYTDATLKTDTLWSAKGSLRLWAGSSFQTTKTYRGILPMLPGSQLDSTAQANVTSYIDDLIADSSSSGTGPYSEWTPPAATYWVGKTLFRNTAAAPIAEQHASESANAGIFLEAVRKRLENWFDATSTEFTIDETTYSSTNDSGSSRELFYYDTTFGTMLGFPSGEFYLSRAMNDHHFHWGYFVYAASEVARQNPSWVDEYGDMVELLIRDYANWERPANDGDPTTSTSAIDTTTPKNAPKDAFPFLRNFDAYAGHSWAGGFGSWNGNNQESSSEAVNAYAAMIRWGEITGNDALRDAGVFLYTQEVHAVWEYWFDSVDDSQPDDWGTGVTDASYAPTGSSFETATKVRGIGYDRSLWWSPSDPVEHYGINWIPTGGHSFYLGREKDYANSNWQSLLDAREQYDGISDPDRNFLAGWKAAAWSYRAFSNPDDAVTIADGVMTSGGPLMKDGGNSGPAAYQFVHALDAMGTPDEVTADTPFYQTFSDGTERTYVVYNASDTSTTVTFSDGYSMSVAANALAAESSTANYSPDESAPESPANLTVDGTTYNSVDLSWDTVTDEESGLFYYGVYLDGEKIAESADPATTLSGLSAGTTYDIAVTAVDLAGNESSKATATASTDSADTAVPSAPSGLFAIEWDADSVELAWTGVDAPDFGIDHYNVYVDGTKQTEASAPPTTISGLSGGEVELTVTAVNGAPASNESDPSDPITVTLEDPGATNEPYFGAPQPLPGRLNVEYYDKGGPNVAYRDTTAGQETGSQFRSEQSVAIGSDADDSYNIAYTAQYEWLEYTVTVDSAGTYDIVGNYANNSGTPGGPVQIEVDGEPTGEPFTVPVNGSWTDFEQSSLGSVDLPAGTHVIRLYLEGGGFNLDWLEFRADGGDTAAPSAPANVAAESGESSITLSWDAASDGESSVFLYNVYQDGSPVATVSETTATVEGLTSGTEYNFAVAAQDAFGNESEQASVTARTELPADDQTPPAAPTNLRAINTTETSIDVGWDAATDNVGVDYYTVTVDGEVVAETDRSWYTLDDLSSATTYEVSVVATDAAGNDSEAASTTVMTADRTGQAAYGGPQPIPGTVNAEAFDTGGNGTAYMDTTPGNTVNIQYGGGIQIRNGSDVDIGAVDGNYNVGFIAPGEWMEYTIEVPETGYYDVHYRVASGGSGGTFHLEVDGVDVTGEVSVGPTGGWNTYATQGPVRQVPLTEGRHVLRFVSGGGFNLDHFEIKSGTGPAIDRSDWAVNPTASFDDANGGRAIDGDPTTEWASNIPFQETAIKYAVDMGEEHDLGSVTVDHVGEPQTPSQMDVQVSTDGENWTTASTVEGSTTTIVELGGVTARHFRLVDRDESSTNWWKITEIRATETVPDLSADQTAPAPPTGLSVDATTGTQVELSWDAVEEDRQHYAISVDGQHRRNVTGESAVVGGLQPGESYDIGVAAVDVAGNASAAATTTAETALGVEFTLNVTEVSRSNLEFAFMPSTSVSEPTLVLSSDGDERRVEMADSDTENAWYAIVGELAADETVEYYVEYERAGQRVRTDRNSYQFAGDGRPAPSDLEVTARTPTSLTLSWETSEDSAATGYVVVEAGAQVASVPADQTEVRITGLSPATEYAFGVGVSVEGEERVVGSTIHTVRTAPYSVAQSQQIAQSWFTGTAVGDVPLAGDTVDYETVRDAAANRGGEDE